MRLVKLYQIFASPELVADADDVVEVSDELASSLVETGQAEYYEADDEPAAPVKVKKVKRKKVTKQVNLLDLDSENDSE